MRTEPDRRGERRPEEGSSRPGAGPLAVECANCSCPRATPVLWGEDLLFHLPGRFAVVRCQQCGFHQSWPGMTVEMLQQYYPRTYYGRIPQPGRIRYRSFLLRVGRGLYRKIQRGAATSRLACLLPPSWLDLALPACRAPGKLLDVGAGWGRFVIGSTGMGWQAEALDFGPLALRLGELLGIPAYQGTLEENLPSLRSPYDLISFNHVLEHLPSPSETLRASEQVLANGGVVRIQIPLWRAGLVRLFGKYWSALDLPRHRSHFRPSDIRHLAKGAGFNRILYLP